MRLTGALGLASLAPVSVRDLISRSKIESGEGQEMSSGLYLHGNTHLQSYMYNTRTPNIDFKKKKMGISNYFSYRNIFL